jgi:hypothetical protein
MKPIPRGAKGHFLRRYAFGDLAVGDSFTIADEGAVRPAASMWAKRHPGWKLAVTKLDGVGLKIVRVK